MSTPSRARSLAESRALRLVTFPALYFAQGVPWGFIAVAYVVFLTDANLDNATIGDTIALAYVPWSFKIFAGPLLDRVTSTRWGRRRPFIIAAQLLMGLTLLGLVAVKGTTQLALASTLIFAHNVFAALQDVATDAMAVDLLPTDERGKANSLMWAAKNAGVAVGGGGGLLVAKHFGWPSLFVLNALIVWAVMLLVVAVRETAADAAAEPKRLDWRQIKISFAFAPAIFGVVTALMAPAGYALTSTVLLRLMRKDLHMSEEAIASLSGGVAPIAGVGGALAGGFIADRLGMRKTMGGFMAIVGVSLAVFAASPERWSDMTFLVAFNVVTGVAFAAFSAASLAFYMTLSNPAIGATQFSLYMAATNLTYAWTSSVGGRLADRYGAAATFAIAAALQFAMIGLLFLVDPKRAEARFRAAKDEEDAKNAKDDAEKAASASG